MNDHTLNGSTLYPSSQRQLGAVILIGSGGDSIPERLVHGAYQAALQDLIALLQSAGVDRIIVGAPTDGIPSDRIDNSADSQVIYDMDTPDQPFHFGRRFAELIDRYQIEPALYFGAGSSPLLDLRSMEALIGILQSAYQGGSNVPPNVALTNNLHSSDWIGISRVADALPVLRECDRDNSAAWLLSEAYDDSRRYQVRTMAGIRPVLTFDMDTPSDLALLAEYGRQYGGLLPELDRYLSDQTSLDPLCRTIRNLLTLVRADGRTLGLFGRVSPLAWNSFNKVSRCWTRVNAEERGMVASGRLDRGEVRSMLKPWIDGRGLVGFFSDLADMMDGLIWDNRALLAAMNLQPSAGDRFAADMLLAEKINDSWLRDFTFAAREARIPILMGGHSLVAGGLYLLTDLIPA